MGPLAAGALAGAGEATVGAAREWERAEFQQQLDKQRNDFLSGLEDKRQANQRALLEQQHDIATRDNRAIGKAITDATPPVKLSEDGNVLPSQAGQAQYAAGVQKAMELGDWKTAEHLRGLSAPKYQKVGPEDTIIDEKGNVVFANTARDARIAGQEERKHEFKLNELDREYELKRQLEYFRAKHGEGK